MKPAIFHLANLNLTVTISPDARRWVQEHIVSLETYAWAQADVFKRGGDVDKGVHVEFIEKPHECRTVADLKGAKREKPPAPVPPADYCVHCNASLVGRTRVGAGNGGGQIYACLDCHRKRNPPADTYHTKKTEKIVRGEEWPKYTLPINIQQTAACIMFEDGKVKVHWSDKNGPSGAEIYDDDYSEVGFAAYLGDSRVVGVAEYCAWLRANGHADAAAQLEQVREAAKPSPVRVLKSRSSIRVFVGDCCYMKCGTWGAGAESVHVNPEVYVAHCGYTEITNTPEAAAILADPALLALVGGKE